MPRLRLLCVGIIGAIGWASVPIPASAAVPPVVTCVPSATETTCTGTTTEASGLTSQFKIEVPSNWNGTLALYSHGYSFGPSAATDVGDPGAGQWLLANGYALAGSSYSRSGWALEQAFQDQIAVLDVFAAKFGKPKRTIAWGQSLGGMITAGLVQLFPNRFTAALPMCGVVAGGVGVWNQGLDSEFAFERLQAPGAFRLVNFASLADAAGEFGKANAALVAAQATPQGRARIALSAALADVPGWFTPGSPEPAATDYNTQEANQFAWDQNPDFLFGFFGRQELESRAGGNVSWNTGVDYREQLARSTDRAEVVALYRAAGLDLAKELDTLNDSRRIAADPKAVDYLSKFIIYNGDLDMPVLTMHTTGDGLVEVTDEQAYAGVVASAGDSSLLREVFVHRAGHCTFSSAETVAAFQTLVERLDKGHWQGTDPTDMNADAAALGTLNNAPPSFIRFHPGQFLRRFDIRDAGDQEGDRGGDGND
ncbi:MAG: S9 family peptidase [Candidatus Dormibacteraeota bacterium]|nr:S9 family peptidase [Candidatus Dormibacteraeota bacterium]